MLLEPQPQADGQALAFAAAQGRGTPAISASALLPFDLHQQEAIWLVEKQINLTPAAGPALGQEPPTRLLQQA
jgi:hypothetical protein